MTFKVENTVWNWRKSRTRNEIFRAQYTIELNLKCRQRENDISEDHWTWPKYCKEDNYGKSSSRGRSHRFVMKGFSFFFQLRTSFMICKNWILNNQQKRRVNRCWTSRKLLQTKDLSFVTIQHLETACSMHCQNNCNAWKESKSHTKK